MAIKYWLFGIGLSTVGLLCSCGESQDVPSRQDRTLGGIKEGAPLVRGVADPGILTEATTYQPAKVAETGDSLPVPRSGGKAAAKRGESTADADTQVKTAVRDLVNALQDGEVELVLRSFNPEQVKPLADKVDVLLTTFEKMDLLRRTLEKKLADDSAQADQVLGPLRGGGADLKWDMLDADHASVTPNLTALLFGPKATPTLQLARQAGEWQFQLEAPLSAEDVGVIVAFHEQLQKALDSVVESVAAAETVDVAQLTEMLAQALQGAPGGEPAAAEAKAKPGEAPAGEKPEEKPKPRGKGGGGRVKPGGP